MWLVTFGLHVRCPEGKIVSEELHDQRRIFVAFFGQSVQLGDRVVKGGLGKATRAVRRVQDLVVEHREVQSEAETEKNITKLKLFINCIRLMDTFKISSERYESEIVGALNLIYVYLFLDNLIRIP